MNLKMLNLNWYRTVSKTSRTRTQPKKKMTFFKTTTSQVKMTMTSWTMMRKIQMKMLLKMTMTVYKGLTWIKVNSIRGYNKV